MFRKNFKSGLLVLVFLASLRGATAEASERQSVDLSIEDALQTSDLLRATRIESSPDGKWVAPVITARGSRTTMAGTDVWLVNTETGIATNLTNGGSNWCPKWSPDGHLLAFVSDRGGSGNTHLWIWDATRSTLQKVSDIDVSTRRQMIDWSPDSKSVYVTVTSDSINGGNNNNRPSYDADANGPAKRTERPTVRLYLPPPTSEQATRHITSDPVDLDVGLLDLARVYIDTGRATILVHRHRLATYRLSPDGSHIAYTTPTRFEKPGSQQELFDLAVATVGTNHQEVVASDIRLDYDGSEFSWSPDGALLSYHTNGQWESKQGAEEERIDDCYIVSAAGGPARNVSHFSATDYVLHESEQSVPLWDRVGTYIYFVHNGTLWRSSVKEGEANKVSRLPNRQIKTLIPQYNNLLLWTVDGGRATVVVVYDDVKKQEGFYKIDLATGTDVKLLERGECYAACLGSGLGLPFVAMKDAQHLVYLAEDAKHCSDLWFSDAGFESPRQLTHLNPQFDKYELGAVRLIDWLSDDGERLRGALLLPSTFREGNRYPLVVWVYGGGLMSNYANHFGLQPVVNLQLLATRGYAVLLPDSPQHEEGRAMFELAKTVLSGINKAIDMGIADPERLGVMGQSNGGYSTLALVIQTKRFKAAIEMDGFAEILGLYTEMSKNGQAFGTGLFERDLDIMGGTPWQFRERYIENSPIFYFDRIETPLLIVHGSEDHVVDPFLGDQVFVALRRLGKEVEYAKYEGEGHVPTSYANRVDLCNRVLAWFEKHLKEKK